MGATQPIAGANGRSDQLESASRSSSDAPWLHVDWRAHQHWLSVDGASLNAIELGPEQANAGQPLVFVHGLSGSWPNWLEQLPEFAREHRVVALDLPGFGHSPMPP